MSNDITPLQGVEGTEELQKAVILRGRAASLIKSSQRLLDARCPERPRVRRRLQQPFDPNTTLLTKGQPKLDNVLKLNVLYGLSKVATEHVQQRIDEVIGSAAYQDANRKPYRYLLDDFSSGWKRMRWLIVCMHREVPTASSMAISSLMNTKILASALAQPKARVYSLPLKFTSFKSSMVSI
jgi:hypothetical protein